MLSVEQCKNKIKSIERHIQWILSQNPSATELEWVEQLKRLKVAYALELARAIDRRENGEDETSYS